MQFKLFIFLFLSVTYSRVFALENLNFSLYLFVYTSEQTQSGAGHISMAFGPDSLHLTYYTKYRKADGGGIKVVNTNYDQAFHYDKNILKHQAKTPSLVLKIASSAPSLEKLEALSDHWNIEKPWSLFINNCSDAVKKTLRASKLNPGLAFMISTPNELVEDLYAHHLTAFQTQQMQVVYGNLDAYLYAEPNAVPQTLFGKRKNKVPQKEAILILTGFGSKYHSLKKLKKYFSNKGYDIYVPNYISRTSLEKTVKNLDKFWRQRNMAAYEKVHVFAYIVGSWSVNEWLRAGAHSNVKSIVYDRSAPQERAPYILINDLKVPNYLVFGPIMRDLHQTPYPSLTDTNIQKGLLLETYATAIVRKHKATADQLGPYCWEPACFKQDFQDYKYVPLNHDQMYTHPEVFGEALLNFFKSGNFGTSLDTFKPVQNPFIKHKP